MSIAPTLHRDLDIPPRDLFTETIVRLLPTRPLSLECTRDLVALADPQPPRGLRAHLDIDSSTLCPHLFSADALNYLLSSSPAATTARGVLAALTPLSDVQFTKLLILLDPKRSEFERVLSPHVTSSLRLRLTIASLSPLWQTSRVLAWMEVPLTEDLVRLLSPHWDADVIDQYLLRYLFSSLLSRHYPSRALIGDLFASHPHHPFSLLAAAGNSHLPLWYLARLCLDVPGLAYLVLDDSSEPSSPYYERLANLRAALEQLLGHLGTPRAALHSLLSAHTSLAEVLTVVAVHERVA